MSVVKSRADLLFFVDFVRRDVKGKYPICSRAARKENRKRCIPPESMTIKVVEFSSIADARRYFNSRPRDVEQNNAVRSEYRKGGSSGGDAGVRFKCS